MCLMQAVFNFTVIFAIEIVYLADVQTVGFSDLLTQLM
jgi:hypothetical protein